MRVKLLHHPTEWSNLSASYLAPMYSKHFDIEPFDETKIYDKSHCVIYSHWTNNQWATQCHDQGYRIIIDHLWDPWGNLDWQNTSEQLVLRSNGWFCIANEALWYKSLGLDSYTSQPINSHSFLMLMNLQKPHRDMIWGQIQPHLTDALYSYRDQGIKLADDIDYANPLWQRYVNPNWYDITKYSVVVETGLKINPRRHSEKALKPFAFKHPMIVWASYGHLQWLRTWGFQTFAHRIDESYDEIEDNSLRLDSIIKEIARLNLTPKDYFEDNLTQEILEHNYNVFYDEQWARKQFEENVINKIKEFME
jgi:hypothetical protein